MRTISVDVFEYDDRVWEWNTTDQQLRRAAAEQIGTIIADPGNVLCYWPLSDDVNSAQNWTLRRNRSWADNDEIIVAAVIG